ncbi:MAG: LysM peptidoglycan-binding domain-containing protein [Ardenticatenaceae bacterium]|nr:LysM peptidoglycan-binding domain-containing protein [Ardenticatenaceae bacterium]
MSQHRIQRAVSLSLIVAVLLTALGVAPAAAMPREDRSSRDSLAFQSGQYYIVRRGDTLYGIARRFGTTVEAIMAANGLRSTTIYIGQSLFIPGYQRIEFQRGSTSATVRGALAANELDTYVLRALAGQTMIVQVVAPRANMLLSIHGANGEVLKSSGAGSASWSGRLPTTQDYFITIGAEGGVAANYSLQVTIPPLRPQ